MGECEVDVRDSLCVLLPSSSRGGTSEGDGRALRWTWMRSKTLLACLVAKAYIPSPP